MEAFLIVVLAILLFWVRHALLQRIRQVEGENQDWQRRVADLTHRIYALERAVSGTRPSAPAPVGPEPVVERVPDPIPQPASTVGPIIAEPIAEKAVKPEPVIPVPQPVPAAPPFVPSPPRKSLGDRLRESGSGAEWEAIVGGSWLNKIGVLVFVIGMALLLSYSFSRMGPAGRVSIALALSAAMLVGGVLVERRARYQVFARGLIGGGWAGLYATVYAMQALDAARVIHQPLLGAILLACVAAGMILHSLRYHSEAVTGVAFFSAFAALAITPVTSFSVVALVPLAAALLYISWRFLWSKMAVLGLLATYGTCASRGDSGSPLWSAETIFAVYWLLFEGFDILLARTGRKYRIWESALLPLNALCFALLAFSKWQHDAPHTLWILAGAAATAYFAGAVLRYQVRPPSSFAIGTSTLVRIFSGGYEGPITLTAAGSAASIFLGFHGNRAQFGLLIEAEIFFLAGLLLSQDYPRRLAAALFSAAGARLLVLDVPGADTFAFGSHLLRAWTPSAIFNAALFYLNRALRSSSIQYGYAGSALLALVIGFETPPRFLGTAWILLAVLLFLCGWLRRLKDFRYQGYAISVLSLIGAGSYQIGVASGLYPLPRYVWLSIAVTLVVAYAAVMTALRSNSDRFNETERGSLLGAASWVTTGALMAFCYRAVPQEYLGVAWLVASLGLCELGLRRKPEQFRIQSYLVAASGFLFILFANAIPVRNDSPWATRFILVEAAALSYLLAARVFAARTKVAERERRFIVNGSTACGTAFLLCALWALLPSVAVGPAWAVVSLLLLETGFYFDIPGLRIQGHLAAGASGLRLFFANFNSLETKGWISPRLLTVLPVIASEYYQYSRQRRERDVLPNWEARISRSYLYAAAVIGVVLLRFELGRVFVVTGWSVFALILFLLGERWNWIDLRIQSYGIALMAFGRSLATGLQAPESFGGTLSRVGTGAAVLLCLYAAQLLCPRGEKARIGLERYARPFFSLLATVLLSTLLFHEVSGGMLTIAWAMEALALLFAGFPLRDRTLRLTGLALFLLCIGKLFLYDLRQLETLYRIFSFIVLGVLLVSVSWIYTRFRDRIQRYL